MEYPLTSSASDISHTQASEQVAGWAYAEGTELTALAEQSLESTELQPGLNPDVAFEPLSVQMRYDEHVAQQALQELFENAELECLGA